MPSDKGGTAGILQLAWAGLNNQMSSYRHEAQMLHTPPATS